MVLDRATIEMSMHFDAVADKWKCPAQSFSKVNFKNAKAYFQDGSLLHRIKLKQGMLKDYPIKFSAEQIDAKELDDIKRA